MGAMHGFFDVLGRHMQEQNRLESDYQAKANAEMADHLENLGKTAKPQFAPEYFRAATMIRMTPPGKKPPKEAIDIYGLMLKQVKQSQAQPAQPQSPQPQSQGLQPPPGMAPEQTQQSSMVDPNIQPTLMPPPGMTGAPTSMPKNEPASGAGMASLTTPTTVPTQQMQPPAGFTPPPGMEFTQITPFESMQMQMGMKSQFDQQNRARLQQEAQQLFPGDNYAQANYINEKTVERPATGTANHWASAGQGIIYNQITGDTKVVSSEQAKYIKLAPGEVLLDPNKPNTPLYSAPAKPIEHNSSFSAAKAAREAKLGRPLTDQEVIQLNAELQTADGEPMYQTMGPGGMPVWTPRSRAIGMPAPRTVYGPDGTPNTGGIPGLALTPPPGISDTTQQQLTGLKNSIGQFQNVEAMLQQPKFATLGPLLGRVKLAEIEKLGGLGATPDEIQLAITLQRLLSSQAFAEGGKQLTETELQQFKLMTPSFQDTVAAALVKTKEATKFLNAAYQNRLSVMPSRQRGQLPDTPVNAPGTGKPPGSGAPNPTPNGLTPPPSSSNVVKWGRDANGRPVPIQ